MPFGEGSINGRSPMGEDLLYRLHMAQSRYKNASGNYQENSRMESQNSKESKATIDRGDIIYYASQKLTLEPIVTCAECNPDYPTLREAVTTILNNSFENHSTPTPKEAVTTIVNDAFENRSFSTITPSEAVKAILNNFFENPTPTPDGSPSLGTVKYNKDVMHLAAIALIAYHRIESQEIKGTLPKRQEAGDEYIKDEDIKREQRE